MIRPDDQDELTQRYREASAEDTRRPDTRVRDAVRAHAEMLLAARKDADRVKPAAAANQSRWKVSLLASLALAGMTGLLVLQFDRGSPEEREAVYGQPSPSTPSRDAPSAAQAPPPAPASVQAPPAPQPPRVAPPSTRSDVASSQEPLRKSTRPQPAQQVQPASPPAPSMSEGSAASSRAEMNAAPSEPAARAAKSASPSADATPAPAPPARINEVAPAPAAVLKERSAAAPVPVPPAPAAAAPVAAPRAAAAPAARAPSPSPAQAQDNFGLQSSPAPARLESRGMVTPPTLHDAARTGNTALLERLLAQGGSINAADATGKTPLMLAAIHGQTAMVRRLMALGANPSLVDRDGLTATQHARQLGLEHIASAIENGP